MHTERLARIGVDAVSRVRFQIGTVGRPAVLVAVRRVIRRPYDILRVLEVHGIGDVAARPRGNRGRTFTADVVMRSTRVIESAERRCGAAAAAVQDVQHGRALVLERERMRTGQIVERAADIRFRRALDDVDRLARGVVRDAGRGHAGRVERRSAGRRAVAEERVAGIAVCAHRHVVGIVVAHRLVADVAVRIVIIDLLGRVGTAAVRDQRNMAHRRGAGLFARDVVFRVLQVGFRRVDFRLARLRVAEHSAGLLQPLLIRAVVVVPRTLRVIAQAVCVQRAQICLIDGDDVEENVRVAFSG